MPGGTHAWRNMIGPLNINTKILAAGFAVILTGMAGLVALFIFHISTIATEDRLNAELLKKQSAAYKMRDAAEGRVITVFEILAEDDYFARDALRQNMAAQAGEFIAARSTLHVEMMSQAERQALDRIIEAVRLTQPQITRVVDLAVEEQWSPAVHDDLIASLKYSRKVQEALNAFVVEVEASTEKRFAEIATLRAREMKVIPILGMAVFIASLGVGLFVIRREANHTKTLEQSVRERTNRLAERETHFRTIIETAADGIISTDATGVVESFNPASERIFGYSASEVIGRSINALMPLHDAQNHDGYMKNHVDGGKPKVIGLGRELHALRKDGTTLPIWLVVNRMMVGGQVKFVGIVSDISSQKKAEAEIRQLADDTQIVASILRMSLESDDLDHILQAALELVLDRQNLGMTGRGSIFLRTSDDRLEMRAVHDMAPQVISRCRYVNIGECLCGRTASTMKMIEKTNVDADHDITFDGMTDHGHLCVPINYALENLGVMNLHIPAGRAVSDHDRRLATSVADALAGVIHRHLNQQELVYAKESAEFASRTKTEFLANMSHELRTPLNAIIGYSEMMESEVFGPVGVPKYKEYLNHITSSGRHLYGLINDLLDVSRIESDEFPLEEGVFAMTEVVEECLSTVRPRAEAAGNRMIFDESTPLPTLRADRRRIKQVLINLLHNAIKFTPVGGEITINTALYDNGDFMVRVVDTGIGIAAKDLETVFAMFGQVDGSLARKYDGAGLGLPLSRKLIEKHGGKLELQSELGKGTKAIITLPAARIIRH